MKQDIFSDLYYGRYRPFERKVYPVPEHAAIENKIETELEYFSTKMSSEDYRRFQNLEDLYSRSNEFCSVDDFSCGVCMGALLMMEICNYKEKHLTESE